MFLAGHTLGTPGLLPIEAMQLFADAGLSAAEVIYQNDYRSGLPENDVRAADRLRQASDRLGVRVVALTPYFTGINSIDDEERLRDIGRFRACIDAAVAVGADRIRTYAGSWSPGSLGEDRHWDRLVTSLRELANYAEERGVMLCVENHFNTMTVSARATTRLCREVNSPALGALYDQANLTFTHEEPPAQAIAVQAAWIRHVHVKDLVFSDPDLPFRASATNRVEGEERAVRSRVAGDGILDWSAILGDLHAVGYVGPLSLEYEYRWHPQDLPEPGVGFARSVEFLQPILARLQGNGPAHRNAEVHTATEDPS